MARARQPKRRAGGLALAHAVQKKAHHEAMRARNVQIGEVVDTDPLKIELLTDSTVLDDDDFEVSAWLGFYDYEWGLAVEDNVLMVREQGEWVVFDVIAETTPRWSESRSGG